MRRSGTTIGIIVIVLLAVVVTGFVAYGRGETAGQKAASSDRSGFASRGTSVAGGAGGFGGRGGQGGQGAGGSAAAGAGTPGAASGANGRGAGGGGSPPIAGKVTKVDNGTLTLQEQPGNTTATVATSATTMVTMFAPGALSDLAMGDIVALQGDKTSDTAFAAKTIYTLSGAQGGGGRGPGGAGATTGTDTAGTPAAGGRGRGAANAASGSSPAGRGAGGGLFPGLNGPTGRITQISGGTLTLQGFDGSTTTVTTDTSTSVRKQAPGALSDIKMGDTVSVQGDTAGDPTAPARAIIDLGAGT